MIIDAASFALCAASTHKSAAAHAGELIDFAFGGRSRRRRSLRRGCRVAASIYGESRARIARSLSYIPKYEIDEGEFARARMCVMCMCEEEKTLQSCGREREKKGGGGAWEARNKGR